MSSSSSSSSEQSKENERPPLGDRENHNEQEQELTTTEQSTTLYYSFNNSLQTPTRSIIKKSLVVSSSTNNNKNINSNNENDRFNNDSLTLSQSSQTRSAKSVRFSQVQLYLFERAQGFVCVPSDDLGARSITLGMSPMHSHAESFDSLDDYLKHKRAEHLNKLEKQAADLSCSTSLLDASETTTPTAAAATAGLVNDEILRDILDNRDSYADIDVELPLNTSELFCPVLTLDERRRMLLECGVDELDESEAHEIELIRHSRTQCGCACKEKNMVCGEAGVACSCVANGIPCQLDRTRYPCACTLKKCKNPYGVKRFDYRSVLRHYKKVLVPGLTTVASTDAVDRHHQDEPTNLENEQDQVTVNAAVDGQSTSCQSPAKKRKRRSTLFNKRRRKCNSKVLCSTTNENALTEPT
jgi:hypothetical protein